MESTSANTPVLDSEPVQTVYAAATAVQSNIDGAASPRQNSKEMTASTSSIPVVHTQRGPSDEESASRARSDASRHSALSGHRSGGASGASSPVSIRSSSRHELEQSLHALYEEERESLATIAALGERRSILAKEAERLQRVVEQARESGKTDVVRAAEYQLQAMHQKQQENEAVEQQQQEQIAAQRRAALAQRQLSDAVSEKSRAAESRQTSLQKKPVVTLSVPANSREASHSHDQAARPRVVLEEPRYDLDRMRVVPHSLTSPLSSPEGRAEAGKLLAQGVSVPPPRSAGRWKQQVVNLLRLPGPNLSRRQFIMSFFHPATEMSEALLNRVFEQIKVQARDASGNVTEHVSIPVLLDILEKHNGEDICRLIDAAELLEANVRNVDRKCKTAPKSSLHDFTRRCTCRFLLNLVKKAYAELETTSQRFAPAVAVAGYSQALEAYQHMLIKSLATEKNLSLEQATVVISKCMHNMRNELETDLIHLRRMEIQAQADAEEAKAAAAARARIQKMAPEEAEALGIPYSTILHLAQSPDKVPVAGSSSHGVSAPKNISASGQVAVTYRYPDGTLVTNPAHLPEGARAAELAAQAQIEKTAALAAQAAMRAEEAALAQAAQAAQVAVSAATLGGALSAPPLASLMPTAAAETLKEGEQGQGGGPSAAATLQAYAAARTADSTAVRQVSRAITVGAASAGGMLLAAPQPGADLASQQQSRMVSAADNAPVWRTVSLPQHQMGTTSGVMTAAGGSPYAMLPPEEAVKMMMAQGAQPAATSGLQVPSEFSASGMSLSAGPAPLRPSLQTMSMVENRDMFRRTKAPGASPKSTALPSPANTRSKSLVDPLRQAGKLLAGALRLWKDAAEDETRESSQVQPAQQRLAQREAATPDQMTGPGAQGAAGLAAAAMAAPHYQGTLPSTALPGVCPSGAYPPSAFNAAELAEQARYMESAQAQAANATANISQKPAASAVAAMLRGKELAQAQQAMSASRMVSANMPQLYMAQEQRMVSQRGADAQPGLAAPGASPFFGQARAAASNSRVSSALLAPEDAKERRIRVSSFQEVPKPQLGKQEVGNLEQVQAQLNQLSVAHLEAYAKQFGFYSTPEAAAAAVGGVPLQGVGALAGAENHSMVTVRQQYSHN
ncbi:hypothetical protein BESB_046440 [Besnoitia besnoiti]|uniref:Uncharacterized protein n=1 Tax=Besnoitia besnoiti TaxID=94643 RepID=A0A2A9MLV0_BESBE|nr:hypothetical protein BESB_046440 [Besnoitia besnoiti]PFH36452.1 hypothetical protein BESB_046440 [Besnoitia besnoiti]